MRTPRPYQIESVDLAFASLARAHSGVLTLATGLGKTIIASLICSRWDYTRGNVLFLAHRVELLDQAQSKFHEELGYEPVVEQAARGWDPHNIWDKPSPVLIASVQTLQSEKRLNKFRKHPVGLIIADECHHATSPSYIRIFDFFRSINPDMRILGVTATPRRHDNQSLRLVFEEDIFQMGLPSAISGGWLVPVRQSYVNIGDVVFERIRTTRNDDGEVDFNAQDLEERMILDGPLAKVCDPILEQSGSRQGLVFAAGIMHAHMIASYLNHKRPGCCAAVDGTSCPPGSEKRREIDAVFREGKIQFIANCDTHTEGFDHAPISVVAMARPTRSLAKYTQFVGRGTRALNGVVDGPETASARRAAIAASGKPFATILDFVGNSNHKLVSTVDVLGGDYELEVRERAANNGRSGAGADPERLLKQARAQIGMEREEKLRRELRAKVEYDMHTVSPFADDHENSVGGGTPSDVDRPVGNGATPGQVRMLVKFGFSEQRAMNYGKKQANAMIDDLMTTRCTLKQEAILRRSGYDPQGINFKRASELIDEISRTWKKKVGT